MRLTMLGTGHAVVTECYNTCFVLQDDRGHGLLVDGGGGVGIVTQMAHANIPWSAIREVFVTHRHIDHILGIVWVLRMVGMEMHRGAYEGTLRIHGNEETLGALERMAHDLLRSGDNDLLSSRVLLVRVTDGQRGTLMGRPATFFDVGARDVAQLGFCLEYEDNRKLVCCGDVVLRECNYPLAQDADWLLHESFCLSDHPAASFIHRAGHSTVAEAARIATRVKARNLLLYHTEDGDLAHRAQIYAAEAAREYAGAVHIPRDLESVELA